MRNTWTTSLAVIATLVLAPAVVAQTPDVMERFTFVVPNQPESTVDGKGPLQLNVHRWSTDDERDTVVSTLADAGPAKLLDAFRDVRTAGYLKWPGGLEYTVHYARQVTRPDGQTEVVLVVDRPLWVWWDAGTGEAKQPGDTPFSVVQIRIGNQNQGEGRISSGLSVTSDKELGVVLSDGTPIKSVEVKVDEGPWQPALNAALLSTFLVFNMVSPPFGTGSKYNISSKIRL